MADGQAGAVGKLGSRHEPAARVKPVHQRSALDRLKDNLLQLEINTILKDEMTAQPMPALPHALLDIAGNYYRRMVKFGVPVHLFFDPDTKPTEVPADRVRIGEPTNPSGDGAPTLTVDHETFDRLRWAARAAESKIDDSQRRQIVVRICNNCDTLKGVLDRANPRGAIGLSRTDLADRAKEIHGLLAVDRDDYVTVQKIWDVGTEQVMLQTAISVTGDVNTRIRRDLAPAERMALLEVHKAAVTVSVESWQNLVATAVDLLKAGFSLVGRWRSK